MENTGKIIAGVGVLLLFVGLAIWLLGDKLGWFGRLPGDIRIQTESFSCFVPITSMIIISVVLSLLLTIISRLLR